MNEDHTATCHALVLSTLSSWTEKKSKVQNARMTSVTMVGYNLSYVLCNGDACSMKNVMIPFIPSLNSSSQVRARLIDDHHRALNPKFSWLVTDPIIGILFGFCLVVIEHIPQTKSAIISSCCEQTTVSRKTHL